MFKTLSAHEKKILLLILTTGAIVRFIFYKYIGHFYWHNAIYFEQGDTSSWMRSITNLVNNFHYTVDPDAPNGEFFRPPGYSFFLLPFYLIAGKNWHLTYQIVAVVQPILDVISIYFVFAIARNLFSSSPTVFIATSLYAFYPFIIVWNPIIYAESTSIFFMLGSLYFLLKNNNKWNFVWSGLFMAASVLTRLQTVFIMPAMALGLYLAGRKNQISYVNSFIFFISFGLLYGLWPARNYINYNRIVFGQDVRKGGSQGDDLIAFYNYIFTIKTDIYPQFDQVVFNKKVEWPAISYLESGDSATLDSLVKLCRDCGTGFTRFKYDYKLIPNWSAKDAHCDSAIIAGFDRLTAKQKEINPMNSYLITPLNNLSKAIFKSDKYKSGSKLLSLVYMLLFGYRSLLLFLGLGGIILMINRKEKIWMAVLILVFFIAWYFYLSFVYRNMEIRYLLSCDVLLLFPAAYFLNYFYLKFLNINSQTT